MKELEIKPIEVDIKTFKMRNALENDVNRTIQEDTLITTDGKPTILYCKFNEDTQELRAALKSMKYGTSRRTSGMQSVSKVFGYMPRRVKTHDYCHSAAINNDYPAQHYVICKFAEIITQYYQKYFPDVLKKHYEEAKKVSDDWIMDKTPFTSGIINKDNALNYHHDAGNFKGVLSNMIVLKSSVQGGHLVCPEYNLKFKCDDSTIVIFDGQQILHGVTNIIKNSPIAYRYSVVYYTLQQMWKCDGINEELKRIRSVKKQREFNRIQ